MHPLFAFARWAMWAVGIGVIAGCVTGRADVGLITTIVLAIVIGLWRASQAMAAARASTYGRCGHCGLRLDREPFHCPRCSEEIRSHDVLASRQVDLAKLRAHKPSRQPKRKPAAGETEVSVFSSLDSNEARELLLYLKANGLRCHRRVGEWVPATKPRSGPFIHIMVLSGDRERAKELLAAVQS